MINQKILVVGPSWLGDMVMAQALFKHLKLINNNIQIDVTAPSWSFPLLERMPEVTSGIELNFAHGEWSLEKRYQFGKSLRKNNYTSAIILPNSWKSALVPWFAKITKRIGWFGEIRLCLINDIRYLKKAVYPKMVERYVALAYPANYQLPDKLLRPELIVDNKNLEQLKSKFNINADNSNKTFNNKLPIIALSLGAAFGEAKCWPEEYFIELAYTAARDNKFNVWILGTKKDLIINNDIQNIINFSGKTNLLETIDLLSLADIVVCNDSGLMHIAASLNKKIIAIYGATSEEFTPPLADNVKIINKKLSCSPCFSRVCPLKHHNCMRQITVEEIFRHIQDIYQYKG